MKTTVSADALNSIIHSQAYNPSNTLGIHEVELDGEKVFSIRAQATNYGPVTVLDFLFNILHHDRIIRAT